MAAVDRTNFDDELNGLFAAFQKPAPRTAILDEAFKPVSELPNDFLFWAMDKLKEEEKLPANLGRELKRLWPAFKAETTPAAQPDPYANEASGDPMCPDCHGAGWHYVYPLGQLYKPGLAPYAVPCLCNSTVDSWEHPPRKASLEDLKRSGRWTMRPPQRVRNGDPKPLGFSLQELMARLRSGRGIEDEAPDPRRQMPEYLQ